MGDRSSSAAEELVERNSRFTHALFAPSNTAALAFPPPDARGATGDILLRTKLNSYYRSSLARAAKSKSGDASPSRKRPRISDDAADAEETTEGAPAAAPSSSVLDGVDLENAPGGGMKGRQRLSAVGGKLVASRGAGGAGPGGALLPAASSTALQLARDRPTWHAPFENYRVIMGHVGWVRSVAVEPGNEWFATGSADRTIKVWDLASGKLKVTLTGHLSAVRGLAISPSRPYMFSAGEDKTVKCWDLEQNKVIRHYHGHLSGVYAVALHPELDLVFTAGRDAVVRVWDMRSRRQVFALEGHRDTVNAVVAQGVDPQVVSSSVDGTVRLWDLAAGKCMATLTNHKKGVRALALHPTEFSFASASIDNIKTWAFPHGEFMRNLSGHTSLVNSLAINHDGVLVSGADNGDLRFWDYASAHCYQSTKVRVQPGSMENEAGVFAAAFDHSDSRVITCEADKTIKMWRQNQDATPETHPLEWTPDLSTKGY